jgi:flagellar biosynthesis protein FlhF
MRIKKFVGQTVQEAMVEMKRIMGSEAVVLNTRKITKGGLLNFLSKEYFEVTAALDDQPRGDEHYRYRSADAGDGFRTGYEQQQRAERSPADIDLNSNLEHLKRVAEQFTQKRQPAEPYSPKQMQTPSPRNGERYALSNEIDQIKNTLRELSEHIKYTKMPALPENLKKSYLNMLGEDVDEKLAADIVQTVYGRLQEEQYFDRKLTEKHILREIESIIAGKEPVRRGNRRKSRTVVLVGPTGVGKTTTIAKLASISKLIHQQDVALISVDTFRIGAIEQLRTFASIADIPMEVVYKPAEMQAALRKFRSCDVIYIDTVGRSQRKPKELNELRRFVDECKADEVHLVMSASTTPRGLLDIASRFAVMQPNRVIFSKLDEAVSFGPLLNVSRQYRLPISFVTTGQDVPDDIVAVDSSKFASMVYTGVIPHA